MKRILSIILALISILTLASCYKEDEIKITQDNTSSVIEETSEKSSYTDKTVYIPKENENGKLLYREGIEFSKPVLTTYYHNYSSAVSLTFDDGYDEKTGYYVSKIFNRYGFTGTAMISATFVDSEYKQNEWNKIFSYGYLDLGVHGWEHINAEEITSEEILNNETIEARDFLKNAFPTQNVLTFATPFTGITDEYKAKIQEFAISNRLGGNGTNTSLTGDLYLCKAISFGGGRSYTEITPKIDVYLSRGEWISVLMHVIKDDDVKKEEFDALCLYLSQKESVWVSSFERVSIYAKQLENARLDYTYADSEKIKFKLSCDLDSSIYNIPMSAKIYIPDFVTTAYVVVEGEAQKAFVKRDPFGKYVVALDIPVGEEVTIYLGENNHCENDCPNHEYVLKEEVESTCVECGYTLYMCNECGDTYKARYTVPKGHKLDYSTETVIKAPTDYTTGISKSTCTACKSDVEYVVRP